MYGICYKILDAVLKSKTCRRMSCPHTEKMHLDRRVPIFYNGAPMINPKDKEGQFFNPIDTGGIVVKMNDDSARIFAKVTEFPVSNDCPWAAESMYVLLDIIVPKSTTGEQLKKLLEENMYSGTGILVNHPKFCCKVAYGDRIRFKGGSSGLKPIFDRKVE
jgi:hypothetical protein